MTDSLHGADMLRQAVALHRAGNLHEAARLYRAILNADAKHVDALTLLGTVCLQRGEWEEGLRIIDLSLAPAPGQPHALVNRGNALTSLKRFDEAVLSYDRAELGLPGEGVVFCCSNNNYKIEPTVFDVWMRLLRRIEGSVLWLLAGDTVVPVNLRREAHARGVSGDRIVFAPRMSLPNHLARHRLADLFLDTFCFNAHTTASNALWAGLPVLTCEGETFVSRIGASVLTAMGLPELITRSHAEYETLAFDLAAHPGKLASIKQKVIAHRLTHPLFDTPRFTRNLENAYTQMWTRFRAGLSPEDIRVAAPVHSEAVVSRVSNAD